jgi:hypothetical protein
MTKGISLHIGVNSVDPSHYGGWSGPLSGCEADAEDLLDIASGLGFEASLLLTGDATRDAVLDGIQAAAAACEPGDIFFLSYSGHGGQVPDLGNDRELDLKDETWCLFDGQLIDDELWTQWESFHEGVRVLVLSDSCHSGTAVKAAYDPLVRSGALDSPVTASGAGTPVFRVMPDDVALRTYRKNRKLYRALGADLTEPGEITATVRLISGCQDNQLSLDGTFNGLFTGTLLRVWADGRFDGTYAEFHAQILSRMPPTQSPNHIVYGTPNPAFDTQQPFTI